MSAAKKKVAGILELVDKKQGRGLSELVSKKVLEAWDIPVNCTKFAKTIDDAIRVAREIRYPLTVKISSPDILHKSEAKGVRIGVSSELELQQVFKEIIENARSYNPKASIRGVTIQEYIPKAREVIVGGLQDPSFGPTVMFGLGGVWVETLKDVSFRLAPVSQEDAREMIKEIKGYPILAGIRGAPPADIDAIVDIIQKVGQLMHEFPEIAELDINPLLVSDSGKGAIAVDARVLLKEKN